MKETSFNHKGSVPNLLCTDDRKSPVYLKLFCMFMEHYLFFAEYVYKVPKTNNNRNQWLNFPVFLCWWKTLLHETSTLGEWNLKSLDEDLFAAQSNTSKFGVCSNVVSSRLDSWANWRSREQVFIFLPYSHLSGFLTKYKEVKKNERNVSWVQINSKCFPRCEGAVKQICFFFVRRIMCFEVSSS